MLCKEIIGKPKVLTERKFYGRYWHSITAHAGKQSRIVSLRSTNTEEEERYFNTLQGVTKLTSRKPGDIITPSLIRLQAEQKLAESKISTGNPVKVQESKISKYYNTLPPQTNTVIPNQYIIKHPKEYQAHLQSVSDFIACGEGVWWRQIMSGVEFFDGPDEPKSRPQGPALHHFRSSNLVSEEKHLHQCWEKCLNDDAITIPHRVIRVYNKSGDCTRVIHTDFLDRDDESESDLIPEPEEPVTESLEVDDEHDENEEELTILEAVTNPECNGLSGEYSDDEDEEQEQMLVASPSPNEEEQTLVASPSPNEEEQTLVASPSPNEEEQTLVASPSTSQQTEKSPTTCEHSQEVKSKLCKNIARIVGATESVYQLDTARQKMKQDPRSNFHKNNYEDLLVKMQTQVLAHQRTLKNKHKEWEKQYYLDHDCAEATLENLKQDKEQYSIYKKLILCEELLKHWKITVHLY